MAKKKVKNHKPSKKYSLYTVSGGKAERKNRFCPKCGPGVFMGKHPNRLVCGTCAYTEIVKQEAKSPKK